jgi:hypothetical protein
MINAADFIRLLSEKGDSHEIVCLARNAVVDPLRPFRL